MVTKIDQKIVSQKVIKPEESNVVDLVEMHEGIKRPELLLGSTYRLKPPDHISPHALYITINDIVLNEGTESEKVLPYEIFINSKAMANFQWIIALTRVISAVFRKGGDITFLIEELESVYDPNGGYMKKGGKTMPSLVAEIGTIITKHLKRIGVVPQDEMDENTKQFIAQKRKEYEERNKETQDEEDKGDYPPNATLCHKCNTKAVVILDNCGTCLHCGYSKCG